ncbi:hypothetical protein AB0L97_20440 [Nocardia sp. NPDC051911]|uniref:hypothetical protein n=1 Tax=Nocardia sp. NPDC051911 TaxID=3154648 RepID=UPI003421E2EC
MATSLGIGVLVQAVGVVEQGQGVAQHCGTGGELFSRVDEARFEAFAFAFDGVELGADFGLGHRAVCCQVDEVVLPGFELLELTFEGGVPFADVALLIIDGGL